MSSDKIAQLIDKHVPPQIAGILKGLVRNSIRITTKRVDEDILSVGASKIGGMPDLPSDIDWPYWQDKVLSFIAQFDLSEVSQYDEGRVLPASGMLYFFYDAIELPGGYDPADRGGWRSFYFGGDTSSLTRIAPPPELSEPGRFSSCALEFHKELTIP